MEAQEFDQLFSSSDDFPVNAENEMTPINSNGVSENVIRMLDDNSAAGGLKIIEHPKLVTGFQSYVRSDVGARDVNEDRVLKQEFENGLLCAIFDGHTGSSTANFFTEHLVTMLNKYKGLKWSVRLSITLTEINNTFSHLYPHDKSGATGIIGYFALNGECWIANIGDCRAFICSEGTVIEVENSRIIDSAAELLEIHSISRSSKRIALTRSHRPGLSTPESNYYTRLGYKTKNGYTSFGPHDLQPTRSLGDVKMGKDLIRLPEVYYYKLTLPQLLKAQITMVCDGFEANQALSIDSLALLLNNPLHALNNPFVTFKNTYAFNYIKELSGSLDSDLVKLHAQVKASVPKEDQRWLECIDEGLEEAIQLLSRLRSGDSTIQTRTNLILALAKMLGSDDNLSIISVSYLY